MIDPPVGLPIAVGRPVVVTNGTAATSHPQQQQQQYTPSQSPHRHHHQTHRHAATATGAATAAADGDHEEDARGHGRGGDRRRSSASAADDAGRRHAPRGPPLGVIGEIRGLGFELGPWLIVAFMLMLAHVADSVPSAATATETPWLAPALCEAAPNRWVSFSAADASAAPASSSKQGADANMKRRAAAGLAVQSYRDADVHETWDVRVYCEHLERAGLARLRPAGGHPAPAFLNEIRVASRLRSGRVSVCRSACRGRRAHAERHGKNHPSRNETFSRDVFSIITCAHIRTSRTTGRAHTSTLDTVHAVPCGVGTRVLYRVSRVCVCHQHGPHCRKGGIDIPVGKCSVP